MDKSKTQPHQSANAAPRPVHPLLRHPGKIDDMMAKLKDRAAGKEFQVEELQEWKLAVSRLADSPDGKVFLAALVQFSDYFAPQGKTRDTVKMVEDRCKIAFYLTWVRPFLTATQRSEIE